MGIGQPFVHPARRAGPLLCQLARRQHHLAGLAVDLVAVRVDVDEVVVLAHRLEVVQGVAERAVVPQPGVAEGRFLGLDVLDAQRLVAGVAARLPVVEPEREPGHRDVVRDVLAFLCELVGRDREALDELGVDAREDDRGRHPRPDCEPERPHHLGERAANQEGRGERGDDREHVEGEEPRARVREPDAGRPAVGAVGELVLVELVAGRDREQVQAGEDREVDADRGDEGETTARGCGEVARERGDEPDQQQRVDDRLEEPKERQLEQEVADVAAEHGVGDGRGRAERDLVAPEQHRLPMTGHRCRKCKGNEHGHRGRDPDGDRGEVGDLDLDRRGASRPVLAAVLPRSLVAERAAPEWAAAALLGAGLHELLEPAADPAAARRIRRRDEPAGDPEVAQEEQQREDQHQQEQPDLCAQTGPEHVAEADAPVPHVVGDEVDQRAREAEQDRAADDDGDEPEPSATHAHAARRRTIVRAAHRRSPPAAASAGPARHRTRSRTRLLVVGVRGVGWIARVGLGIGLGVGVIARRFVVVGARVVIGRIGGGRARCRLVRVCLSGLTAPQLVHELVEEVAHGSGECSRDVRRERATRWRGRTRRRRSPPVRSGASSRRAAVPT